jgi:hypothetical protein
MLTRSNIIAIKEQIKVLESLKDYIPKEEIELMMKTSDEEIETAKLLQSFTEELEKSRCYLPDKEIKAIEESLEFFQLK